jgi:NAD+ diphosphatase
MKYQIDAFQKVTIQPEDVCFIYHNGKILVHHDELGLDRLPSRSELQFKMDEQEAVFRLSEGWALNGENFQEQKLPKNFTFRSLRDVLVSLAIPIAKDASVGAQYVNWSALNKFCGHCGQKLSISKDEIAKVCGKCTRNIYPQLSPVIITLVRRGREILLAKAASRTYFSCVAGFVEPGESLEESIRREVKEEVGLEVKNIKYFGSQPWPFPNNLMVGFSADWVAGDIKVDGKEIADAKWFDRDNLPEEALPPRSSISRQMIEAFKKG